MVNDFALYHEKQVVKKLVSLRVGLMDGHDDCFVRFFGQSAHIGNDNVTG
jgi:hypothetical protein